jgi:hypothetical protein
LRQTAGRKPGGFIFVAFGICLRLIAGFTPARPQLRCIARRDD